MANQIHKKFTDEQVKNLMNRYVKGEIRREDIERLLGIAKSRFFILLKKYREQPETFSVQYQRSHVTRPLDPDVENNILNELKHTKDFIDDKNMPIWSYNYSFIRNDLEKYHHQKVALSTIIKRAKKHGFYIQRKKKQKIHDREVITNHVGELIQHDSSYHRWSPYVTEKWWLITSLDDFSRMIFYAMLVLRDTALAHIRAIQSVFLDYGLPMSFYVDSDSVFRFIRDRDVLHYRHHQFTDQANPQWKQILHDCQVKIIYALSPQAKGKVERPYRWLQDHLVRICARDNISTIDMANQALFKELHDYNYKRVHSTTGEIPSLRYKKALKENKNLLRPFVIPPPFQSPKDIFCLRLDRTVDAYRTVSVQNMRLKFNNAPIHQTVNLRIYPDEKSQMSEIRFWFKGQLLDVQKVKSNLLPCVHF